MPQEISEPYDGVDWMVNLVLTTTEKKSYVMPRAGALMCGMFKQILDESESKPGDHTVIPVPKVEGTALMLVFEFIEYHADKPFERVERPLRGPIEDSLSEWDKAYLDKLRNKDDHTQHKVLIDVMKTANFMGCKILLDLCCGTIASMINGKPAGYIRGLLHIKNDFSEDQKKKIEIENTWCEDKDNKHTQ